MCHKKLKNDNIVSMFLKIKMDDKIIFYIYAANCINNIISWPLMIMKVLLHILLFSVTTVSFYFLGIYFTYTIFGVEIMVSDNNFQYSWIFLSLNIMIVVLGSHQIKRILDG